MTDVTDNLRGAVSVERWIASIADETVPDEWVQGRLEVLAGYLKFVDRTPDDLVAYFFLRKKDSGQRFVSGKRRTEMNEKIEEYVLDQKWVDKEAVAKANIVRSFLIHNGIPIGGRTWTGG